jgi:hypothetical protein
MHTTPRTLRRILSGALAGASALSCGRPTPATAPTAPEPALTQRVQVVSARWEDARTVANAGRRDDAACRYPGTCFDTHLPTSPAVATNGAGAGVAAWQRHVGGTFRMVAARFDSRNGWAPEQPIDAPAGSRAPLLAVDRQGRALAVWYANGAVYASQSAFDGGWTVPQALVEASAPTLAMDDSGNATVVATRGDGVVALRANPLGEWAPAERIDDEAPHGAATASTGTDGTVLALWTRGATANVWGYGREWTEMRARTARTGEAWSALTTVHSFEGGYARNPHSAGGDTVLFLTESAESGPSWNGVWAQRREGGGWTTPVALGEGRSRYSFRMPPRLARLGADTLAVWMESGTGPKEAHALRARVLSAATGTWGPTTTVADREGALRPNVGFRLAASVAGNAVVVWGAYGAGNSLLASDYVAATGWSAARELRSGVGSPPEIAMDDLGNATVVWSEFGDPLTIHAARLLAATAPAP